MSIGVRSSPYWPVVSHPQLGRVLPGLVVSALGDGMSLVAVTWLALQLAPDAHRGTWVAFASAAGGVLFGRFLRHRGGAQLVGWNAILRAAALGAIAVTYALGPGHRGRAAGRPPTLSPTFSVIPMWWYRGMDVVVERPSPGEFQLVHVADPLVPAVLKAGFVVHGSHWCKRFPADTPHLDRAWSNFSRLVTPMLRQSAGLDPVPWDTTLDEVCRRLNAAGVDWWLTGSAALAVRGLAVTPGDLDLVVSDADSHRVGDLLLDGLIEPVAPADWFCAWWGRAMLGARVEWVGGVGPLADQPEPTDFGLVAAAGLEVHRWRGWDLRLPPLALQRAVSVRRDLHDRVRMIDARAGAAPG